MTGDYESLLENNQIRDDRVDDLLVEVFSGKYIFPCQGDLYASRTPTGHEQDQGRVLYVRALHEVMKPDPRGRTLMRLEQLEKLALESGALDAAERAEKDSLIRLVKRHMGTREKTHDPQQKLELEAEVQRLRKRIYEIEIVEQQVLQNSAESKAEESRNDFYVACCTLGGEMLDQRVWQTVEEHQKCQNWPLLEDSRRAFVRVSGGLPIRIIRALARHPEWRNRWKSAKETATPPFEGPLASWDRNKQHLVYWSDFYDAIHQHPECPDEVVIGDDDLLNDWLNQQTLKRQQEKQRHPQSNGRTLYYRDGHGNRRPMTMVGEKTIPVNTPYRMPMARR